jgi:hypothetical protein
MARTSILGGGSPAQRALRLAPLLLVLAASFAGAEPATRAPVRTPTLGAFGPVDTWVLHYDPALGEVVLPTMEDLLGAVHPDSRVLIAVPTPRDARTVRSLLGITPEEHPQVGFVVADELISGWARDRYIAFEREGAPVLYAIPERDVPEGRRGDVAVARALLDQFPERRLVESPLVLEGGNCVLSDAAVFVGPQVIDQNLALFGGDAQAVLTEVGRVFAREVVLVGGAGAPVPHDHVDMFLTALDEETLLLGDPRLTQPYFEALRDLDVPEGTPNELGTFTWPDQLAWAERYDAVCEDLLRRGFSVERIPILHTGTEVVLTWNNAVLETRAGVRTAFVPRYGIPVLDRLAQGAWRRLGFLVHPIRARGPILQGGAVRCLSNDVRRAAPPPEVLAPALVVPAAPPRR